MAISVMGAVRGHGPGQLPVRAGCVWLYHVHGRWLHERGPHAAPAPRFAAGNPLGGTVAEQATAAAGYISYAGPYEVREDIVVHRVEVSLFPNWIGSTQERYYEFTGEHLSLSTAPLLLDGREQRAFLVWERAA